MEPFRTLLCTSLALALAGCAASDSASRAGDLGRGTFRYACTSTDDAVCASGTTDRNFDFPTAISVGGRFTLTFTPTDGSGNYALKPASTEFLSDDSVALFRAKKAGRVAVVARSTANGKAADLTYVRIAQPTKIRILGDKDVAVLPKVTLKVGEELTLRGEAKGSLDETLGGSVDYDWAVSDASVLELRAASPVRRMTIRAAKAGASKLEVKIGETASSVDVEVTP